MMIRKIIVMLCALSLFFVPTLNAMTIAETEAKIAEMQQSMEEEQQNAANAQYTYDQLDEELHQMAIEQEELEARIIEMEGEIATTEAEIAEIEEQLPVLIDQANEVLSMLQVSSNQNYVLDQLFSDDETAKTAIRKTNSLSTLTEEAVKIVNQVIEMQIELEEKQASLESQQNDLAYEVAYLEEQIAYSKTLQAQQKAIMAESESQIDDAAADVAIAQEYIALLEAAGCGPDDIYGETCGVVIEPSPSGFVKPMNSGYVTAEYGASEINYTCGYHNGIDLSSSNKTEPIYSVASGQVVTVLSEDDSHGYGNYVIVQHNVGGTMYFSKYAHLSSVNVVQGQTVDAGTQIGNMGNTGESYGAHLHLSIQEGGNSPQNCNTIDPRSVIDFPPLYVYWEGR